MKPKGYWADPTNRRQFLEGVAHELGFDPKNADSWQHVTIKQIRERVGAPSSLFTLNNNFVTGRIIITSVSQLLYQEDTTKLFPRITIFMGW